MQDLENYREKALIDRIVKIKQFTKGECDLNSEMLCFLVSNLPLFHLCVDDAIVDNAIRDEKLDINQLQALLLLMENCTHIGEWFYYYYCNVPISTSHLDPDGVLAIKPLADLFRNDLDLIQALHVYSKTLQDIGTPYHLFLILLTEDMVASYHKLVSKDKKQILSKRKRYEIEQKFLQDIRCSIGKTKNESEVTRVSKLKNMYDLLFSEALNLDANSLYKEKLYIISHYSKERSRINRKIYESKHYEYVGIEAGQIRSLKSLKSGRKSKREK